VNVGTHRSEFTYDGDNRRVRIVEKENSTVVSDERFVWDRNEIAERRDASGAAVTARLYRHGLQENGASRNLTRDHLLSIREVSDSAAGVQARYEYAPFGTVTKVAGSNPDFLGFTGVLLHDASDLFLMKRRAYDTALGRWLSEDPLGTHDGPNLYAYVANEPLRWIDPDGTVAMALPWQPNGNAWGDFTRQDNICSQPMGALGYNGAPCIKKCCQAHDACYTASRCNWTSWLTIAFDSACTRCNRTAVLCILNADIRPDACN
jgi:RHS repeat-associated protein